MVKRRAAKETVTIIDIAHAAGVSKSTVSLVLTGRGSVKQETRRHVLEIMGRLGYVYNRGAANLRNSDSKIVGVVLSGRSEADPPRKGPGHPSLKELANACQLCQTATSHLWRYH